MGEQLQSRSLLLNPCSLKVLFLILKHILFITFERLDKIFRFRLIPQHLAGFPAELHGTDHAKLLHAVQQPGCRRKTHVELSGDISRTGLLRPAHQSDRILQLFFVFAVLALFAVFSDLIPRGAVLLRGGLGGKLFPEVHHLDRKSVV